MSPVSQPTKEAPRFVILFHQVPESNSGSQQGRKNHWDLMIQSREILETWSLEKPFQPHATVAAQKLPPHRLAYLTYEGAISRNRGSVERVDSGYVDGELPADFSAKHFSIRLRSSQLLGIAEFSHVDGDQWTIRFVTD